MTLNSTDMTNRYTVITGASDGIGLETAKALAARGIDLTLLVRSMERGEQAARAIRAEGDADVDVLRCDLMDLGSVRAAAAELVDRGRPVDVLLNNAGATFSEYGESPEGVERTMAVNHVGHFVLTHHLMPVLEAGGGARVVNVASDAHYRGTVDPDDVNRADDYTVFGHYCNSKQANVLFTKALARRAADRGITTYALHPGLVRTRIGNKAETWWHGLLWSVFSAFGRGPGKGAETSVFLATADDVGAESGSYFADKTAKRPYGKTLDEDLQDRFWMWSMSYV